jgi:hypothetical protein
MTNSNTFASTDPNMEALKAYVIISGFVLSSVPASDDLNTCDSLMDKATADLFTAHGIPFNAESRAEWSGIIDGWDSEQRDGVNRRWLSVWSKALTTAGFGKH